MSDNGKKKPKAEPILLQEVIMQLGGKKALRARLDDDEDGNPQDADMTVGRAMVVALSQGFDAMNSVTKAKGNEPDAHQTFKAYMLADKLSNGSTGHSFTDEQKALVKKGMAWSSLATPVLGHLMRVLDPAMAENEAKLLGD